MGTILDKANILTKTKLDNLDTKQYPNQAFITTDERDGELDENLAVQFAESERQKSKNLFDKDAFLYQRDINLGETNQVIANSASPMRIGQNALKLIAVKPNTRYVFSNPSNFKFALGQVTIDKKSLGDTGWLTNTPTYSFITTSNTYYLGLIFGKDDNSTISLSDYSEFMQQDYQLEEGEVATDYQPYNGAIVHEDDIKDLKTIRTLPYEYQEVEYIESTGTQYINTGYVTKYGDTVEIEFEYTTINNIYNFIYGATSPTNNDPVVKFGVYYHENIYAPIMEIVSDTYRGESLYAFNKKVYKMVLASGSQKLYIDGIEVAIMTETDTLPNYTALLFAANDGNNAYIDGNQSNGKLYKAIIKSGSTLVREFVPCYRKSDGEIGLFDTVNNMFYTNQGAGTFLKGENIYLSKVARRTDAAIKFAESERQKSKNLFNINADRKNTNTTSTVNGNVLNVKSTHQDGYTMYIVDVKKNTNYTVYSDIHIITSNSRTGRIGIYSGNTDGLKYIEAFNPDGNKTTGTFNTGDYDKIALIFYSNAGGSYAASEVNFSNIQLEEGDRFTDYQPYNGAIVHEKDIQRHIITGHLLADYVPGTTNYTVIPLVQYSKIGNRLTMNSNGGVVIGKDVKNVMVNAGIGMYINTIGYHWISIYKNNKAVATEYTQTKDSAARNIVLNIPRFLLPVNEGDIITFEFKDSAGNGLQSADLQTQMTVEAVE